MKNKHIQHVDFSNPNANKITSGTTNKPVRNKQTAIEWLEQEFITLQNYGVNELGLFAKAKEMEKLHIINTFKDAQVLHTMNDQMRGEQYYNETYGK